MKEYENVLITITLTYILIGAFATFVTFLIGKIKQLDDRSRSWYIILNTTRGFIFFMIRGSIGWLPVYLAVWRDYYNEKARKGETFWQRMKRKMKIWADDIRKVE